MYTYKSHYKPLFDIIITIPLFIASLPIICAFSILILIVDFGPPFFVQERIGLGGKKIKIYKLRSMYCDSEYKLKKYLSGNEMAKREWYSEFKLKCDPRILPIVGRFIRRTSIDELPQLANVLQLRISLVGPRPLPNYHLDSFSDSFKELRNSVRPGITGLWQVLSRNNGDQIKLEKLDREYISKITMLGDVLILLRTIHVVLFCKGAY